MSIKSPFLFGLPEIRDTPNSDMSTMPAQIQTFLRQVDKKSPGMHGFIQLITGTDLPFQSDLKWTLIDQGNTLQPVQLPTKPNPGEFNAVFSLFRRDRIIAQITHTTLFHYPSLVNQAFGEQYRTNEDTQVRTAAKVMLSAHDNGFKSTDIQFTSPQAYKGWQIVSQPVDPWDEFNRRKKKARITPEVGERLANIRQVLGEVVASLSA